MAAQEGENRMGNIPKKAQSKRGTGYDSELQMFVDAAHEPTRESLLFMRWLAEQGRLEHDIAGPSAGEYADTSMPRSDLLTRGKNGIPVLNIPTGSVSFRRLI